MKAARLLATEITLKGARVYDLLANEATERLGGPNWNQSNSSMSAQNTILVKERLAP